MVALPRSDEINPGASKKPTFRRDVTNLGDGYVRRAVRGINSIKRQWSITYNPLDQTDGVSLYNTLEAAAGVTNFDWTPPGETASKWVVDRVTFRWATPRTIEVSATLIEDFTP